MFISVIVVVILIRLWRPFEFNQYPQSYPLPVPALVRITRLIYARGRIGGGEERERGDWVRGEEQGETEGFRKRIYSGKTG